MGDTHCFLMKIIVRFLKRQHQDVYRLFILKRERYICAVRWVVDIITVYGVML